MYEIQSILIVTNEKEPSSYGVGMGLVYRFSPPKGYFKIFNSKNTKIDHTNGFL